MAIPVSSEIPFKSYDALFAHRVAYIKEAIANSKEAKVLPVDFFTSKVSTKHKHSVNSEHSQ